MFGEAKITAQAIQGFRRQTPWQRNSMSEFVQIKYPNYDKSPEVRASDLNGLCVLIVDDSSYVAAGIKMLLESCGADILGPVATIAEAESTISVRIPDVAIVDITLRGGEQSYKLIDRLCEEGVRVVVATGDPDVSLPFDRAAVILQKPMKEDSLLASLRPGSHAPRNPGSCGG
jgi:CheY-like chemotaxis protein